MRTVDVKNQCALQIPIFVILLGTNVLRFAKSFWVTSDIELRDFSPMWLAYVCQHAEMRTCTVT